MRCCAQDRCSAACRQQRALTFERGVHIRGKGAALRPSLAPGTDKAQKNTHRLRAVNLLAREKFRARVPATGEPKGQKVPRTKPLPARQKKGVARHFHNSLGRERRAPPFLRAWRSRSRRARRNCSPRARWLGAAPCAPRWPRPAPLGRHPRGPASAGGGWRWRPQRLALMWGSGRRAAPPDPTGQNERTVQK